MKLFTAGTSARFRKFSTFFFFVVLLFFSAFKTWQTMSDVKVMGEKDDQGLETTMVKRVIDGDTIELGDGRKVRYIGIDTPETQDPRKDVECYGLQAAEYNKRLVGGQIVELESDLQDTDRYGRLLRYVWLEGELINEQLVAEGYAVVSTYPPNVKYQDRFLKAQVEAYTKEKGLWGECPFDEIDAINHLITETDEKLMQSVSKAELEQIMQPSLIPEN